MAIYFEISGHPRFHDQFGVTEVKLTYSNGGSRLSITDLHYFAILFIDYRGQSHIQDMFPASYKRK